MSLHDANAILDRVKDGVPTPDWIINLALQTTGDLHAGLL